MTSCRRRVVAALVLALGAMPAAADELDVSGSWQINLDCSGFATATSFITHTEDLPSGVLGTTLGPPCGTIVFSGEAVAPIGTCATAPSPYDGQVTGTAYQVPSSGFYHVSETLESPVFWDTFGCLVARAEVDDRFQGTITESVGGVATRVNGTLTVGSVALYDPDDTLCFSLPGPFTACTFDMLRNEVVVGTNVTVRPNAAVTVTFATVSSPGTVAVTPLNTGAAAVPGGFQVFGSGLPIFYDVTTTAAVSGTITTCYSYPDADQDGIVDGTTLGEAGVRLLHEEGTEFVDRTSSLDTVANVVCAETTSLSQLAPGVAPTALYNYFVPGTKLVLRRSPTGVERGVFKTKLTSFGAPYNYFDDGDATFEVATTNEGVATFNLPAAGWTYFGTRAVFDGTLVASPVRKLVYQNGVKIVVKLESTGLPLLGPLGPVSVRLVGSGVGVCAHFGPDTIKRDEPGVFRAGGAPASAIFDCSGGLFGD